MTAPKITSQSPSAQAAVARREELYQLFRTRPMDEPDLLVNLTMYMRSGPVAKLLFLDEVYRRIVNVPGIIMEFGVWLGATTITLENLWAVHEPYNVQRRIVAFDTFEGDMPEQVNDAGTHFQAILDDGTYTAPAGFAEYLGALLAYHESENVGAHVQKHRLVVGDASVTCPAYLADHPEAMVSLAYFDMALEEPTVACLTAIRDRLLPGSVLVLDEFGHPEYPGETCAYRQVIAEWPHTITRSSILPDRALVTITG